MPDLPPPGTFRLHPFAEPPVPAGLYLLTGEVSGLPGPVEPMRSRVEITAPRYALPPDQVLSTFPPAGARGSFTSRLPQIVLRRRTLPWERSTDLDADVATTPTPWLALVLIAEGEGRLLTDVPVGQCVTPGVSMGADTDVPKGACLEVPESVVRKVFPTLDDLRLLCHVRAVDLRDTELAMGDDDGWMAVVLCNRLPQAGTRYLACLVNLENQFESLPEVADIELASQYVSVANVFDIRVVMAEAYGQQATLDTALMGLPGVGWAGGPLPGGPPFEGLEAAVAGAVAAEATGSATVGPLVTGPAGPARTAGEAWATQTILAADDPAPDAGTAARLELADGFSFPAIRAVTTLRFPVLTYWSFTCEEQGDFQYLATNVHVRMLGHVVTGPETPDGDPAAGAPSPTPPSTTPEPETTLPLPLVAETGHVEVDHLSRRGEPAPAWFRGPLAPAAVPRPAPDAEGRVPLAHHADQLRRVVPDGREDLGYAAAFEIGRLLALSQPGVVASLGRWRQELFGAARARAVVDDTTSVLPNHARALLARPDVLDPIDGHRASTLGARAARAVVDLLAEDPVAAVGNTRPVADPGAAAGPLSELAGGGHKALLAGLGVQGVQVSEDAAALLDQVAAVPVALAGAVEPGVEADVLRAALEDAAMLAASGALPFKRPEEVVGGEAGESERPGPDASHPVDALDRIIEAAARRRAGGHGGEGGAP